MAALKQASAELDRLLAAHAVDDEAVAAEFKVARKSKPAHATAPSGKGIVRKRA